MSCLALLIPTVAYCALLWPALLCPTLAYCAKPSPLALACFARLYCLVNIAYYGHSASTPICSPSHTLFCPVLPCSALLCPALACPGLARAQLTDVIPWLPPRVPPTACLLACLPDTRNTIYILGFWPTFQHEGLRFFVDSLFVWLPFEDKCILIVFVLCLKLCVYVCNCFVYTIRALLYMMLSDASCVRKQVFHSLQLRISF